MNASLTRRLRQITQVISFGLYLFIFVQAVYLGKSPLPSDLFYRLDPLIATTAMLAGRAIKAGLLYSLINLAAAMVFGRVWCGWICPFGSFLEWFSPHQPTEHQDIPNRWRGTKYILLVVMLTAALMGNQTLVFLDPVSIMTRSMTAVLWPGLRYLVFGLESVLYAFEPLWPLLDGLNRSILLPVFQGIESVFIASLPVALTLLAIIGLNYLAPRFWCRYICPLGGLLGFFSRRSLVRRTVNEDCISCDLCAKICPTGTIDPHKRYASDPAECTVCHDCTAACPVNAISFMAQPANWQKWEKFDYDPGRRQVLMGMAAAVGGVALAGIEPIQRRQPERMIRPPGAMLTEFTALCMRCGECVRVCPTQGLQPSLIEGGWQNIFTPRLVPRLGYCSYSCNACIQVCPTGAIPPISLDQKQLVPIGLASINTDRCLPWAYQTICSVCEEMCPLPDKAIKLEDTEIVTENGEVIILKRPVVVRELCIGCGICEYHCPVGGEAAIQVQTLPGSGDFLTGI